LGNEDQKQFLSGRGCPYKCNFCFNAQLMEKYGGLGKYVRKKPVGLFIEEIERTKVEYGADSIYFSDDTFVIDREWLIEFLGQYRNNIKTPFMCVVRADQIDEEVARELSLSGCHTISMGVETGNERIRKRILNKNISNETLQHAAGCFRENNIRIQTSNMFGIPGETVDDALQTIRFNIELGASFAFAAMLMPFPGTGIEKVALELGWLDEPLSFEMLPQSFFSRSLFKVPEIQILDNVKSVASLCIMSPKLYGIFEKLVRLRCRLLFYLLNLIGLFFRYKSERNLSLINTIRTFWRFRSSR
ncbi:MAG: radical SAM protein, partial [Desulfatiglandales bacterium]